ncbi:MAG: TolC family protein [Saprospiraceae bacterium]|nr:TolC family protein [Saprospiraceae bacterium]
MDRLVKTVILILATCCFGNGQSIDSFILMAKKYNPGLKALNLEYEASLNKVNQVNEWPDPKLSLGIGALPIETRLGAQRFKIGISQSIPWKGFLDAKGEVASAKADIISHYEKVKTIDIAYSLRMAYASLAFLESTEEIEKQRLEVLKGLKELAKSAVNSGQGKLSNVLFVERQKEVINANLELIKTKKKQPTIHINRWTGRALNATIEIKKTPNFLTSKNDLLAFAQEQHPQFEILNSKIDYANSKVKLTKFQSKPKINIGLDYANIDSRNDIVLKDNGRDVLMPMGSISIPINKGKYDAIRQEETLNKKAIQAHEREFQDMFLAEIELAYEKIEYAQQTIKKFESLKEITTETLKLMRTEYMSSGTRFEELLRLEMDLIDYDLEILKAEFEKNQALATLHKFK